MAMNSSCFLDEAIFSMTGQKKSIKWWTFPFAFFTKNKGIYAYEVAGQVAFPLFTADALSSRIVVYFIKGHPEILDGGTFGLDEKIHKDAGGAWRPVLLDTYSTHPFEVVTKIYSAYHELEAA